MRRKKEQKFKNRTDGHGLRGNEAVGHLYDVFVAERALRELTARIGHHEPQLTSPAKCLAARCRRSVERRAGCACAFASTGKLKEAARDGDLARPRSSTRDRWNAKGLGLNC
jgi:hypothetical protein